MLRPHTYLIVPSIFQIFVFQNLTDAAFFPQITNIKFLVLLNNLLFSNLDLVYPIPITVLLLTSQNLPVSQTAIQISLDHYVFPNYFVIQLNLSLKSKGPQLVKIFYKGSNISLWVM